MAFDYKKIKPFEKRIYLSSPTMHGEEIKYMTEAYTTNWMTTAGANIEEIEAVIAQKIGCKYAVALSSATAALHLSVKLAGVKRGDRVFCSDMTFAATANPISYEGATQIYIDTERETWNMDPEALERAFELYPDVKTVMVANLYGVPAKLDEICEIARRNGAIVIEDAAESLGARYNGMQTGLLGDIGVISFNGNKIITGSSGGMLLTNSPIDAERAKKWSTQARESATWYQHEELGYNYRMSNVVAGVVRGQIPYLEEHIALKKAIYERYKAGFKDLPITLNPYDAEKSEPNFWLSCMLIDREAMANQIRGNQHTRYTLEKGKTSPDEIIDVLVKHNVEARPIWKPMHMQPYYKDCKFVKKDEHGEDVGNDIFTRGLCLPSDIKMTEDEQNKIIEIIKDCFE